MKRVGCTNQIIGPEEVRQRLLASGGSSWDSRVADNTTLADVDEQAVEQFISKVRECGRRAIPENEGLSSTLDKLGLTISGQPTRAAILLLGKAPQRFYSTAYIKAGRFKSPTMIVDDKEFGGTLFQQLDATMAWFRDRLETRLLIGSKKLPGLPAGSLAQRQEVWEYPLDALREAVVNAICHRSYTSLTTTTIRLFDNHLAIWNPGHLAYQLSPDDLLRQHNSYPPNKLIAESLYNIGLIERWGTGTLQIANALKAQGLPPPQFDVSTQETFKLLLSAVPLRPERRTQESRLNERQVQALEYLRSHERLTNAQYQKLFDASRATAHRDLTELVHLRTIISEGIGKATSYRLSEEP